jgi:hypothetical protein
MDGELEEELSRSTFWFQRLDRIPQERRTNYFCPTSSAQLALSLILQISRVRACRSTTKLDTSTLHGFFIDAKFQNPSICYHNASGKPSRRSLGEPSTAVPRMPIKLRANTRISKQIASTSCFQQNFCFYNFLQLLRWMEKRWSCGGFSL